VGCGCLGAWLSPKQRDQFDAFWYFDVVGSATGKKYRIHFGGGRPTCRKLAKMGCEGEAGASYPQPVWCRGDVMFAQKIALKTNAYPKWPSASAGIFGARKNILAPVGSYTRLG
jgi:hypothetical protein